MTTGGPAGGGDTGWTRPQTAKEIKAGQDTKAVVDVAYPDAEAYAQWAGKRLPTEAEWEFAARGGLSGEPLVWGDKFRPHGRWMANTLQGHFPDHDTGEDGYVGIAASAQYPPNGYGLYDMAGNVWQWTSDWDRPEYYEELTTAGAVARNPQGPSSSPRDSPLGTGWSYWEEKKGVKGCSNSDGSQ